MTTAGKKQGGRTWLEAATNIRAEYGAEMDALHEDCVSRGSGSSISEGLYMGNGVVEASSQTDAVEDYVGWAETGTGTSKRQIDTT